MDEQNQLPTFDYQTERAAIEDLISQWGEEENKCKDRRTLRQNRKSTLEERAKGTILKDETIIPDRTIASNIRRSSVPYKTYVTQSKRVLTITDVEAPSISIEPLELWFTRGMRYPGWKNPWFKLIDAMHVHGGAAIEIIYDPTKPLNCGIEYIPRAELIFPKKTRNLQNCPRLLRCYEVTSVQLEEFVSDYEFDPNAAKEVLNHFSSSREFVKIYRELIKKEGLVYNAWYCKEYDRGWLREPRLHDIGLISFDPNMLMSPVIEPSPDGMSVAEIPLYLSTAWPEIRTQFLAPQALNLYPIFWFSLQETEVDELLQEQGRVSLDNNVQEAMTRLLSNTVNATTRAANIYPSVEGQPGDDAGITELGPIKPGVLMSKRLIFNQFPWPNNIILAVQQALKIGKADESGQTDFAATARKDANKTAKEMELATSQASLVVSSDMDVFSSPFLEANALLFNISCHQAIFQLCKQPTTPELLIGDYNLQSAADTEVVKREEDKQNAKEFFNIVQGTPAADKILRFLIQRFFPDQADEWIAELSQPDLRGLVMQLIAVLQQVPTDGLAPEQKLSLANLVATAQQLVGVPPDEITPPASGDQEIAVA